MRWCIATVRVWTANDWPDGVAEPAQTTNRIANACPDGLLLVQTSLPSCLALIIRVTELSAPEARSMRKISVGPPRGGGPDQLQA